jgi:MYXO-CTERM domain-containing protein
MRVTSTLACAFVVMAWAAAARGQMGPTGVVFGPERPVDLSPFLPDANATRPEAASDGANVLVVWASATGIVGARATAAGALVDLPSLQISDPTTPSTSLPAVAFGDSSYLVVWTAFQGNAGQVVGARVGTDGQILDPVALTISPPGAPAVGTPAVVFDGGRFLVAWTDDTSGEAIVGAYVTPGGLVEESGFAISPAGGSHELPLTASNGSGTLVLWSDVLAGNVVGTRVSVQGAVLDPGGILVANASAALLAGDGTGYLAAWTTPDASSTVRMTAARIDAAGEVTGTTVVATGLPIGVGNLVFDGQRFLAVREGGAGYDLAIRMGATGAALDASGPVTLPGVSYTRALAAVQGRVLAVSAGAPRPLAGALIDASASPTAGAPFDIAFAPAPDEDQPVVARSGTGYVVAWRTPSPGPIWAARVSGDGEVFPSPVLVRAGSPAAGDLAIGGDGSSVLVTWEGAGGSSGLVTGAQLLSSTLAPVGQPLLREPKTGPALAPRVGFDGHQLFGLTEDLGSSLLAPILNSFSIDPSTGKAQPSYYLGLPSIGSNASGTLALISSYGEAACSATRCLVAYVLYLEPLPAPYVFGPGLIETACSVPGDLGPITTLAGSADDPQWWHQVLYDGTNWLVVWADNAQTAIHATRIAERIDGTADVLDVPALSIASGQTLRNLSATFDGQLYLVAWENGAGHVAVARITTAGVVLDPGGVDGPDGSLPSVAGNLVAYSRVDGGRSQVFVRTLSAPGGGGVDAGAAGDGAAADAGSADANPAADVPALVDAASADDASADATSSGDARADAPAVADTGRPDAAAPDAGKDGGATPSHGSGGGCSCAVGGERAEPVWLLLALAVVTARRRRRRA